MEIELSADVKNKRLNTMVAVTVLLLSVVMGLCNIKDGNLVQAMQQAKADSVDRWGEYQATRTKTHVDEAARSEVALIAGAHPSQEARVTLAALDAEIAKYNAEAPRLQAEAKALAARYDALNVHDDQFDASEALVETAISIAAVAALAESFALLTAGWAFGAFGIFMGLCGFAGWAFHPDVLSNFLG